jgi:ParB family chromosome partitioning protein
VLPDEVKQMVRQGLLSLGQCKILLGLDDADQIIALAKKAVAEELTVKRLEQIVKLIKTPRPEKPPEKADIFLDEAKISLRGLIGKPTEISKSGEKYVLKITFDEKTEISDIISRLSNEQI